MPEGLAQDRWVLELPYLAPPLSANRKMKWQQLHRVTQEVMESVGWVLRSKRIPALGRCRVQLHWRPGTSGRRDTDNLAPFLKPIYDAVKEEGIVEDDSPAFMEKPESVIHEWRQRERGGPVAGAPVFWVVIERLPLYDSGGELPSVVQVVTNRTGRAERVTK